MDYTTIKWAVFFTLTANAYKYISDGELTRGFETQEEAEFFVKDCYRKGYVKTNSKSPEYVYISMASIIRVVISPIRK